VVLAIADFKYPRIFILYPVLPNVGIGVTYSLFLICVAGIAQSGYGLDGQGLIPGSSKTFFSPQRLDWLWGPPILLSSWVLQPERATDHLPLSGAEVRNGGAIPPLIRLHGVMLN
jgi:hypothetical protein